MDLESIHRGKPNKPRAHVWYKYWTLLCPISSPKLDKKRLRIVQQIIDGILYYARAVDITVLSALGTLTCEQSQATEMTKKKKVSQLLDYLVTKPNAKVRLYASSMVLNIHSDASYLSEPWAYSHISSNFFLGNTPIKGQPSAFNRAIYVLWNFKICRGLSSGSWTSSPIFGLQGRKK